MLWFSDLEREIRNTKRCLVDTHAVVLVVLVVELVNDVALDVDDVAVAFDAATDDDDDGFSRSHSPMIRKTEKCEYGG